MSHFSANSFLQGFFPAALLTACLFFAGFCSLLLDINHWFTSCISDHSSSFTNKWVLILRPSRVCVSPELNGRFCASLYVLIIQLNKTCTVYQNCVTSRIIDNYSVIAGFFGGWKWELCGRRAVRRQCSPGMEVHCAFLLGWKRLCTFPCTQ